LEQKITIGSVCFIQHPSKKQVLMLRRLRDPMRGKYTGVGGKAEFCEDVRTSCFREVLEETGLIVRDLELKGVVKTIHRNFLSSWILFVYIAQAIDDQFSFCEEGNLQWVDLEALASLDLIGFIRNLLPYVFTQDSFFEGQFTHDTEGNVVFEQIFCTKFTGLEK
jgi:8-oxo-dGTP diphosphatase